MATHTFVELHFSEARYIADLTGIEFDLMSAKDLALKLQDMLSGDPPDHSLVDPLSIAILVKYSRVFVTGVRDRIKVDILQKLSPNQKKNQDHLRALRDKHIAHSVNCFEENVPIALYCEERVQEEGITGISCQHNRVVGLSSAELTAVVELADVFLKYVAEEKEAEIRRLLPEVRSMPLEDVLSGGMGPFVPGRGRADRRRSKY